MRALLSHSWDNNDVFIRARGETAVVSLGAALACSCQNVCSFCFSILTWTWMSRVMKSCYSFPALTCYEAIWRLLPAHLYSCFHWFYKNDFVTVKTCIVRSIHHFLLWPLSLIIKYRDLHPIFKIIPTVPPFSCRASGVCTKQQSAAVRDHSTALSAVAARQQVHIQIDKS